MWRIKINMITSIQLKNFKCFRDSGSIDFSRITLLTGANGTGKSTVMQSLLLLAQSVKEKVDSEGLRFNGDYVWLGNYQDIVNAHSTKKGIDICIHSESNNVKHVFDSSYDANPLDEVARFTKLTEDDHNYIQEVTESGFYTSDGQQLYDNQGKALKVKGDFNNDFSNDFNVEPIKDLATFSEVKNIYYLKADRHGPRETEKIQSRGSNTDVGTRGEFVFNVLHAQGINFQESVKQALSFIMGGANMDLKQDDMGFHLYMDSVNGKEAYKQVNVGFAYSYVLPIIVAALLSKPKGKIFIENPEAHLHPRAQSQLMSFLYKQAKIKDIQIIIETHSDHILHSCLVGLAEKKLSIKDLSIYYFSREEKDVKNTKATKILCTENGRIKNAPAGFFDQMDLDLDKLLEY